MGAADIGRVRVDAERGRRDVAELQLYRRSNDDHVTSLAVASSGAIAAAGITFATNLPLRNAVQGTSGGGVDTFLQVIVPEEQLFHLDTPAVAGIVNGAAFSISGYAVDVAAASGTGVDAIHVYAYPEPGSGQTPIFLGAATYGAARSDAAAALGARLTNSGFVLNAPPLAAGRYLLAVFPHLTRTGWFGPPLTRNFISVRDLSIDIEQPRDGPATQTFTVWDTPST